jgi:hypothetical protein
VDSKRDEKLHVVDPHAPACVWGRYARLERAERRHLVDVEQVPDRGDRGRRGGDARDCNGAHERHDSPADAPPRHRPEAAHVERRCLGVERLRGCSQT